MLAFDVAQDAMGVDNNANARTDCDDPACSGRRGCPGSAVSPEAECTGGDDNPSDDNNSSRPIGSD